MFKAGNGSRGCMGRFGRGVYKKVCLKTCCKDV